MSSSSSDSSTSSSDDESSSTSSHAQGTAHPLFQVEDDDDDDSEGNTVWINDGERAIHISPERAKAEIARLLHQGEATGTTTTTTTTTTPRYRVAKVQANKRITATAHELLVVDGDGRFPDTDIRCQLTVAAWLHKDEEGSDSNSEFYIESGSEDYEDEDDYADVVTWKEKEKAWEGKTKLSMDAEQVAQLPLPHLITLRANLQRKLLFYANAYQDEHVTLSRWKTVVENCTVRMQHIDQAMSGRFATVYPFAAGEPCPLVLLSAPGTAPVDYEPYEYEEVDVPTAPVEDVYPEENLPVPAAEAVLLPTAPADNDSDAEENGLTPAAGESTTPADTDVDTEENGLASAAGEVAVPITNMSLPPTVENPAPVAPAEGRKKRRRADDDLGSIRTTGSRKSKVHALRQLRYGGQTSSQHRTSLLKAVETMRSLT